MNANLRSNRISLQLEFAYGEPESEELWRTFRRTAVEPGQASSPDIISFEVECLLCAQIVINNLTPAPIEADPENNDSLWDIPSADQPSGSHAYLPPEASVPPPPPPHQKAGLIYLYAGPANLPAGEASVGVIVKPSMQGRGYAREAVQLVVQWAFEELKFHRVQAAILDTPFKDKALRLFIGSGFAHEGTKRRAVYQPEGEGMAGVWKDVTYLAMLDTEWMLRSALTRDGRVLERPVVSVWDEMFARHSKEREELVRWEERHGRVRRSLSTETLRENGVGAGQDLAYLTDDAASSVGDPSISGSVPPSPRTNVFVTWEQDTHMEDDLGAHEAHQSWEHVVETTFAARRQRQGTSGSFLEPSPRGPTLALPSIPSTRLSEIEGDLQSPLTIPSPTGSFPPYSPSPSPVPSSVHNSWDSEDEDNWLQRGDPAPSNAPIQTVSIMSEDPTPRAVPANLRTRSRSNSSSSSSTDSWSDAQSSVDASWDVISNISDQSHHH